MRNEIGTRTLEWGGRLDRVFGGRFIAVKSEEGLGLGVVVVGVVVRWAS
jgi:hypothetical protein